MTDQRVRYKTLFMVSLMVVSANLGDLMLKRGMVQIGAVEMSRSGLWRALLSTAHNGTIWLGILFLIGFTLCYMTAVSWADYSYVMPAGAVGYAVQTLLAGVVMGRGRERGGRVWGGRVRCVVLVVG